MENKYNRFNLGKVTLDIKENGLSCIASCGNTMFFESIKTPNYKIHNKGDKIVFELTSSKVHHIVEKYGYNRPSDNLIQIEYDDRMCTLCTRETTGYHGLEKTVLYDNRLMVIDAKIGKTTFNPNYKHTAYITERYVNVIHQTTDSNVVISSFDKEIGNFSSRTIEFVNNWYLLNKELKLYEKQKDITIYYPYLIIEYLDGSKGIVSLVSNDMIDGEFSNLSAIEEFFHIKKYINTDSAVFYKIHNTFICVDEKIYDDNLKLIEYQDFVDSIAMEDSKVLDTCGPYVAFEKNGIYIFTIGHYPYQINKVCYCYKEKNNLPRLSFSKDDVLHFDLRNKKFMINLEDWKNLQRQENCYDDFLENYSIMEALDGDPEAYWNID